MLASVTTPAHQILKEVFGYEEFRGQQQTAIERALAGQDSLVLMPTGGGKSACYQVPALLLDGITLVVSPLIALMQDQVSALRELGVRAAFLNSSLSPEQQSEVGRARSRVARRFSRIASWHKRMPLGGPGRPDEYWMVAMSRPFTSTRAGGAGQGPTSRGSQHPGAAAQRELGAAQGLGHLGVGSRSPALGVVEDGVHQPGIDLGPSVAVRRCGEERRRPPSEHHGEVGRDQLRIRGQDEDRASARPRPRPP